MATRDREDFGTWSQRREKVEKLWVFVLFLSFLCTAVYFIFDSLNFSPLKSCVTTLRRYICFCYFWFMKQSGYFLTKSNCVYMYVNSTLKITFTLDVGRSVRPADPFKCGHQHVLSAWKLKNDAWAVSSRQKCAGWDMMNIICNPSFLFELCITEQLTLSWTCIQQCCLLQQNLHEKLTFEVDF